MSARATHSEWVERAEPAAPPALVRRVAEVFSAHPGWEELPVADALTLAGEELLRAVLGETAADARACALDLLAADACVTWAFEVAATAPDVLPGRAQDAMQRIFMARHRAGA